MLATWLLVAWLAGAPKHDVCACLPADFTCDDVVSAPFKPAGKGRVDVRKALADIQARCQKGGLVDAAAKPILLYRRVGCWGNPPENYQEILQQQERELTQLRKRNRVIELTCNPEGAVIS